MAVLTGHQAAQLDEAINALVFVLGWSGGIMEARTWRDALPRWRSDYFQMGPGVGSRVARFVRTADERFSSEVRLGIPAPRPAGGVRHATAFWAFVEGTEQNQWLTRFRPVPTIVLREGASSRRWAIWSLEHPVRWVGVDRGNRRVSHRLRAPKKYAEPEKLWLPAPGSCIRSHGGRPVPVVVEQLETVTYQPMQVIGHLKDAPAADAWREGAA